jgi:NADH-quinone oxidoreductase subunit G
VLANMLGLPGFEYESAQEVLVAARGAQDAQQALVQGGKLSNETSAAIDLNAKAGTPVTAAIYQLDGIVRRAPSLQLTADGKAARAQVPVPQAQGAPA